MTTIKSCWFILLKHLLGHRFDTLPNLWEWGDSVIEVYAFVSKFRGKASQSSHSEFRKAHSIQF